MPGFDRRGPNGMGPATGRGMGYCVDPADRARGIFQGSGGFRGRGYGRGAGAYGRGMANRYGRGGGGYYNAPVDYYGAYRYEDAYPPRDEAEMLKNELSFMEARMKELNSRISELEPGKDEKEE